jgi:hypothetical protein
VKYPFSILEELKNKIAADWYGGSDCSRALLRVIRALSWRLQLSVTVSMIFLSAMATSDVIKDAENRGRRMNHVNTGMYNHGKMLYEKGIRLGMGQGCKKDPMKALEVMKAADRIGYGPAALVCAMAEEIKPGWMTTDDRGANIVTAASRLRTYIGTADIGGYYDIFEGKPFVSSSREGLGDDKFVARVQSMYRRAKGLGIDLAEDELKRFNATVARQRELVATRRQRQEAAERREREHMERISKSEKMREPLIYDAEPGWTATFAGYVIGQAYPPPESGCVTIYCDTVKEYHPQKTLNMPFHGMEFLQLTLSPTSHRLFNISAIRREFDGDRKSFLDEGRALLKDLGGMMGMELAPFKFEAPDWPYWPNGLWSGPLPELYLADESKWANSRHVFAFSHTKKGHIRINVRLGIVYDKPQSISMSILDCDGEQNAEAEFDKAFRAKHNGQSWTEWCKDTSNRRSPGNRFKEPTDLLLKLKALDCQRELRSLPTNSPSANKE